MKEPLTQLTDEEALFADTVQQFADDVIGPRVHDMDTAGKLDPEIIPLCFELGLMGIEIPEKHGGGGASFFLACLAVERLSSVDPSVGVFVDVQNTLFNNCLLRWGNEAQIEGYAPRMATDTVGAYALSESSSGSDAFGLSTRAERDGDEYLLNGSKLWITNGAEAGAFVVFATIDPDAGYKGITAFLV
ncbi:MAG: acyl-CoA dehydrogenase family protein, partial [Gemmatimonadetes bacterium]|nr:acyl-CoA dehydrogenase family protein [Gemmatimonadota bacterium]